MFYAFSEQDSLTKLKESFPQLMQNTSISNPVNKGQKTCTKKYIYLYSEKKNQQCINDLYLC